MLGLRNPPAAVVQAGFVPVIDLGPARSSASGRQAVARAIDRACEESGFLVVVGHGVDEGLVDLMYAVTRAFFRLAPETKAEAAVIEGDNGSLRGWKRFGGYVAAGNGIETPPDLCELFTYNRLGDTGVAERSGLGDRIGELNSPNQWPAEPPKFRETWLTYYAIMERLASEIMQLLALGLDLPEDFFDGKIDHHMSNLTANWYYPLSAPPLPGQFRKGPHSDWGSLTILYQDEVGGLQVVDRSASWVDVPCIPGSFVINIGDLMAVWTNDRWVSTVHRVLAPTGEQANRARISIPFFHQPNFDAVVECLPSCLEPGASPRHAPVTSGAWLRQKATAAYGA